MLTATRSDGVRVVAVRELDDADFLCPMCESSVTLKRGRVVTPHFAHKPGADCPASEGESPRHLQAKLVLWQWFIKLGYEAQVEETHRDAGRRVDVAATLVDGKGMPWRFAIEAQDSSIQVQTMKDRISLDKRLGYVATGWVFTHHRASRLMTAGSDEVRVPDEMLYVENRYRKGVHVIDASTSTMWNLTLSSTNREDRSYSWYEQGGQLTGAHYPGRTPKTIKRIERQKVGFRIGVSLGRYSEYAVHFMTS